MKCLKVCYYKGPEQYHSSYAVLVKHSDLNSFEKLDERDDFTKMSSLIRINETVSKVFSFEFNDL